MSDARNAKVVSAKSFGAIFLRQPLTRLTQYLQHTVHKYYSMVLLSIAEYLRRFPRARALVAAEKGNYFLRSYYHGLDFRTHCPKPDGSRARIIYE